MLRYSLVFIAFLASSAFGQDNRFAVGAQAGLHSMVPVAGAEVLVPATDRTTLGFGYVAGEISLNDLISSGYAYDRADMQLSEASVTARWLVSRTFYVGGGLGYRMISADLEAQRFDQSRVTGSLRSDVVQAKILIGNSWNLGSNLYLAADWAGLGFPFATMQSKAHFEDTDGDTMSVISDKNDTEIKNSMDRLDRAPMASLVTLRFGVKF